MEGLWQSACFVKMDTRWDLEDLSKESSTLHYAAPMLTSYNQQVGAFQNIITPEPIQIKVDSGTDPGVVMIGIGGIISSLVIAIFTYRIQRNQIKSNLAQLRHHWRNELRDCSSEFIQKVASVATDTVLNKEYTNAIERADLLSSALRLQIKINLLISKDGALERGISEISQEVLNGARFLQYGESPQDVFKLMLQLEDMVKNQLEKSWGHIQDDLGVNKKFWGFLRYSRKKPKSPEQT